MRFATNHDKNHRIQWLRKLDLDWQDNVDQWPINDNVDCESKDFLQ